MTTERENTTTTAAAAVAPGWVLGTPGGSLAAAEHGGNPRLSADRAQAGRVGEVATGHVLDEWAARPGGPTVLHDVPVPLPGVRANIDHLVVAGTRVQILDSKLWRPGWYWTAPSWWPRVGGRSFRGMSGFDGADGRAPRMAVSGLCRLFADTVGVGQVTIPAPWLVVWPSGGRARVGALRPETVRVIAGPRLDRCRPTVPADPQVVRLLASLLPADGGGGG